MQLHSGMAFEAIAVVLVQVGTLEFGWRICINPMSSMYSIGPRSRPERIVAVVHSPHLLTLILRESKILEAMEFFKHFPHG